MQRTFGVRIIVNDHLSVSADPGTDATIGLIRRSSPLATNASAGQGSITVADGTEFTVNTVVGIYGETEAAHENFITGINGNILTLAYPVPRDYTTANSATCYANSEFRLVLNNTERTTGYVSGVLAENAFSSWKRGKLDLSPGNGVAHANSFEISLNNANRFWKELQDRSMSLVGAAVELLEFNSEGVRVQWSGYVESVSWTTSLYKLSCQNDPLKRRALFTQIRTTANREIISSSASVYKPIFGELAQQEPEQMALAEFEQSKFRKAVWAVQVDPGAGVRVDGKPYTTDIDFVGISAFPVYSGSTGTPYAEYKIPIGDVAASSRVEESLSWLIGKYLYVIAGTGEGEIRRITAGSYVASYDNLISVTVEIGFSANLSASINGQAENQSWVSIYDFEYLYKSDHWPLQFLLDSDGKPNDTEFQPYGYASLADTKEIGAEGSDVTIVPTKVVGEFNKLSPTNFTQLDTTKHTELQFTPKQISFESNGDIEHYVSIPLGSHINYSVQNLGRLRPAEDSAYPDIYEHYSYQNKYCAYKTEFYANPAPSDYLNAESINVISNADEDVADGGLLYKAEYLNASQGRVYLAHVLVYQLPQNLNLDVLKFDRTYLSVDFSFLRESSGTNLLSESAFLTPYGSAWAIHATKKIGYAEVITPRSDGGASEPAGCRISSSPVDGLYWYFESALGTKFTLYTGKDRFEIPGMTSPEKYRMYDKIAIMYMTAEDFSQGTGNSVKYYIYKNAPVKLVLRKSASSTKSIYIPTKGRIFGDTWRGRKSAYTMMEKPRDFLEHLCRLQAFPQSSYAPTLGGWGLQYANNALINTATCTISRSTAASYTNVYFSDPKNAEKFTDGEMVVLADEDTSERNVVKSVAGNLVNLVYTTQGYIATLGWLSAFGSFDSFESEVSASDDLLLATQLKDQSSCYTDRAKRVLCNNAFLLNWINKRGYECFGAPYLGAYSPRDHLTLADLRSVEDVVVSDPDISSVYCEPFVRYNRHPEEEDIYQSSIRIMNVSAPVYSPTYVVGLAGYTAEELWTKCHNLYLKYGVVNRPDAELTDLQWMNGKGADAAAQAYLSQWINMMDLKRISIDNIPYAIAGDWDVMHRFTISLPHQTASVEYEVVVESIEIAAELPNSVSLTGIILYDPTVMYNVQDSMNALLPKWQDHQQTYSERGEGLEDKQDNM